MLARTAVDARPPVPGPARRAASLTAVLTVVATALAGTLVSAVPAPAHAAQAADDEVTMVQANIKTGMALKRFKSDVRTTLEDAPDFVTYNEVPYRSGEILAPDGYSIHRSVRNRYTAATPVVWRHPEWTKVDAGTFRISNVRKVPDGKHTKLGLRFANWATLQSADGRVVSLVAVHFAPLFKIDGKLVDLVKPSARRLGQLVEELAPAGPVLVGGDFNVHHRSGRYPARIFEEAGLVPTYDTLGNKFPTGDHRGATIDFIFNRGAGELEAVRHGRKELYSDHDAVTAGLAWQRDRTDEAQVVTNDPDGAPKARRAASRELVRATRDAKPGALLEVATTKFDFFTLQRALRNALDRGVHVRMTARGQRMTDRERRLRRMLNQSDDRASWFRRCMDVCSTRWQDEGLPPALMMVSGPERGWQVRLDTNRQLTRALVRKRTSVTIRTGEDGLEDGARMLRVVR
jgi:endonuclease/exonuclease/phosphatase (EEP) superfamily protein YafD